MAPEAEPWSVGLDMIRLAILTCIVFSSTGCSTDESGGEGVAVRRGEVVRRALATGFVEPDREAQVNTHLAGIIRKVHVPLGAKVAEGDPLLEVWPALTEQDVLRAERSLASAIEGQEAAREFVDGEHLLAHLSRFLQGERNLDRMKNAAERGRRNAEEALRLLREGRVTIDGRTIDFVVRAPVGGHVLQLGRIGDPVTPASSFGIGTVVGVIGDLDQPVFRGTVDEIDVGRLRVGMSASIALGALPGTTMAGKIVEIGLRARRQDNASLFDVRIAVEAEASISLRAGYSAVAEIELERAVDVPVLPERVIRYDRGAPYVEVTGSNSRPERRDVELGVSDGLLVEIRSGVEDGDTVLEPSRG